MKRKDISENTYIFQKKDHYPYQCGPIVLYNSLVKLDKYMDLDKLIEMCNAHPITGTSFDKMNEVIKKVNRTMNINIKVEEPPTMINIMDTLKSDGLIILLYHWTRDYGTGEHYVLIECMQNNKFKLINHTRASNISYVSYRKLKTMLQPYKRGDEEFPKIWKI